MYTYKHKKVHNAESNKPKRNKVAITHYKLSDIFFSTMRFTQKKEKKRKRKIQDLSGVILPPSGHTQNSRRNSKEHHNTKIWSCVKEEARKPKTL